MGHDYRRQDHLQKRGRLKAHSEPIPESNNSCSHGAGRRMSRTRPRKQFSRADLLAQTEGVGCCKDKGVLDEIPSVYKDIDEVMDNQADLVAVVTTLKQLLCAKGQAGWHDHTAVKRLLDRVNDQ